MSETDGEKDNMHVLVGGREYIRQKQVCGMVFPPSKQQLFLNTCEQLSSASLLGPTLSKLSVCQVEKGLGWDHNKRYF